jgi:hypothetical protein
MLAWTGGLNVLADANAPAATVNAACRPKSRRENRFERAPVSCFAISFSPHSDRPPILTKCAFGKLIFHIILYL